MSISVKNISKIYGQQKAVDHLSFTVNKGEIVGFLGPNGAGKSTTLKILTGFLEADAGEATVAGIPVTRENLESRKKIGYLPEGNPLYTDLYIREYLHFIAQLHELSNARQAVEKVMVKVGLIPEGHKKIGQLSKGYKQRVGLAAAMIHEPEVLILDEPTTGLDPNQISEIRAVIREQGKDKTVLFSSHIMQEVEAICDRVIIINKGVLVANDTVSNLRSGEQLAKTTIEVEFSEPIAAGLLDSLPDAEQITAIHATKWELLTGQPEKLRKQLMELALLHNFNIVSLQSGTQKLEDIFRQLTQKD